MSNGLDYNQIAPEGLEALGGVHGYIAQSSLPATLVDLVYLHGSAMSAARRWDWRAAAPM